MFVDRKQVYRFPRDEDVDIHVSLVTLSVGDDSSEGSKKPYVEIREWLKVPELYGHGIVVPARVAIKDLKVALSKIEEALK